MTEEKTNVSNVKGVLEWEIKVDEVQKAVRKAQVGKQLDQTKLIISGTKKYRRYIFNLLDVTIKYHHRHTLPSFITVLFVT